MSRSRIVKPEFFKHSELYAAEVEARLPLRLAFEGLWTVADREGRFRWKPPELKLEILPYDPVDFAAILGALREGGFIRYYVVDGKGYGDIPSFKEHQTFHHREGPSRLPPHPCPGPALGEPMPSLTVSVSVSGTDTVSDIPSPPAPVRSTPKVTWLTPYWDAWIARFGAEPHPGQLAKHLKRPRDAIGDPALLDRWVRYLARTDEQFVSPAKFAATHGSYADDKLSEIDALIEREKAKLCG